MKNCLHHESNFEKEKLNPKPKTKLEREQNKKTIELAENIRAQRQLELQNGEYGFRDAEKQKGSILVYLRILAEKRKDSSGNYGNWDSIIKHLESFSTSDVAFSKLDRKYVQDFKEYLDKKARTKSNTSLSQNSKYSYFNKFRAGLKQAVKDGIIPHNPAESVEGFKQGEPEREFLTLEELQAVAKAECDIPQLKTAFLFSCLTGLRWSDINKLVWSEVQHSNEMGYYIRFRQKKTKGLETQPISDQAFELLGEREDKDERVFKGLKYSAWHNMKLQQWVCVLVFLKQLPSTVQDILTQHCN